MENRMRSLWDFDAEDDASGTLPPADMGTQPNPSAPLSLEGIGPQIQARLEAGDPPGKIAMHLEQLEPGLGRVLLGHINQAARSMDRGSVHLLPQQNYGGFPARASSASFADAIIPSRQSFLSGAGGGVAQAMNGVAARPLALKRSPSASNSVTVPIDDKVRLPDGSFYIDEGDGSITVPLDEAERLHSREQSKNVSSAEPGASGPPSRAVRAIADGRVGVVGWQNPKHRSGKYGGMGWRIYVDQPDGSRIGYGHMDPGSTLKPGTVIKRGDIIGRYADPPNGHATGPHVHVQKYDRLGNVVDPGNDSPLAGRGSMKSRYRAKERGLRKKPHQGVDWAEDPR
jgi:Peptidase family M23